MSAYFTASQKPRLIGPAGPEQPHYIDCFGVDSTRVQLSIGFIQCVFLNGIMESPFVCIFCQSFCGWWSLA